MVIWLLSVQFSHKPKIADFNGATRVEKDVGGLEVPVDKEQLMEVGDGGGDLEKNKFLMGGG